MENQVQLLEELLTRVQRNRARMSTESIGSSRLETSWQEGESTDSQPMHAVTMEADVPVDDAEVIDLVHPTSMPPALYTQRTEDGFASVAPQSVAPPAPAFDFEKREDDFSSVAPPSIAPAPTAEEPVAEEELTAELPPSMAPSSPDRKIAEDNFSSVAPVSVTPVALVSSQPEADANVTEEIPPSMLPVEPATTGAAGEEYSSDELEIEDTDTASMNAGSLLDVAAPTDLPQEKATQAREAGVVAEPEARTFQKTAVASGNIVSIERNLPQQKVYTVEAVLQRAWQFGKNA